MGNKSFVFQAYLSLSHTIDPHLCLRDLCRQHRCRQTRLLLCEVAKIRFLRYEARELLVRRAQGRRYVNSIKKCMDEYRSK
jgi:hypothetical protein